MKFTTLVRSIRYFLYVRNNNTALLKFNNFFKQCGASRLEIATLGLREKHVNLLSHGGVLFLLNPGRLQPLQLNIFRNGAK